MIRVFSFILKGDPILVIRVFSFILKGDTILVAAGRQGHRWAVEMVEFDQGVVVISA
jgi:hypothetical protein